MAQDNGYWTPGQQPTGIDQDEQVEDKTIQDLILDDANSIDFADEEQEKKLFDKFVKFDNEGHAEYFLCHLVKNWPVPSLGAPEADAKAREFYETRGYEFLRWLLLNFYGLFDDSVDAHLKERDTDRNDSGSKANFLEIALRDKQNQYFVECLLHISSQEGIDEIADILSQSFSSGENSLHLAISQRLTCSPQMVQRCNSDALLEADRNGNLPIHLAMELWGKQRGLQELRFPQKQPSEGTYEANKGVRRASVTHNNPALKPSNIDKSHDTPGGRPNPNTTFKASDVYRQMKRKTEEMREDDGKKFMTSLLTAVNNMGRSPYQVRLGGPKPKEAVNEMTSELQFQREMKSDIFKYITDISAVRTALYGIEGLARYASPITSGRPSSSPNIITEKELFLDMSDFSRPSHSFQDFIGDLTGDLTLSEDEDDLGPGTVTDAMEIVGQRKSQAPLSNTAHSNAGRGQKPPTQITTKPKSLVVPPISALPHDTFRQDASEDRDIIGFEDILFYVCLPDMNFFKESPQCEIRRLFKWLELGGVKTIRHLSIPDSTTRPMCDIIVHEYITKRFSIEKFDWRKLDINLKILTVGTKNEFTELTLYSSGNWGVLYHWASGEGLMALKKLKLVTINIVQLDPSIYNKAQVQHNRLSREYEEAFRKRIEKLKPSFELRINIKQKWDYPVTRSLESKEPFVPNLQLLDQLDPCHRLIYNLCNSNAYDSSQDNTRGRASRPQRGGHGKGSDQAVYQRKLKELTQEPSFNIRDCRVKVAILDNGADRIRSSIRGQIAKGVSYVTGGTTSGQILPWWMVSDPHGTQMASLIAKANPFCRLYIARVGRGRKDILPKHAAEAIDWAIKQNVDIISISWVMKKDHAELKSAINRAVTGEGKGRPTLVFCSTADEGVYSGTIYPASYDGVVNVAATDQYGHMTPASANGVDILVPGENITADGPSYMEKYSSSRVSGSSVATATAAGIASLALLLLRTYNWGRSARSDDTELIRRFYTRDGILGVFDRMNAHKAAVVPSKLFSGDMTELAEAWNQDGFKLRNSTSGQS
ncbi:hypothetical protein ANO14919_121760 [Xylariales sp. No.14919]|nr:hypothetical protein ANO14919_121760 [Xylariales sp. No.14919]